MARYTLCDNGDGVSNARYSGRGEVREKSATVTLIFSPEDARDSTVRDGESRETVELLALGEMKRRDRRGRVLPEAARV